jgi:alkanesulfonate monooxygenase SsuD/methylene tetrahydromethanopterin reductase-like flavin-dependent oxidoreductase (luciferase family)
VGAQIDRGRQACAAAGRDPESFPTASLAYFCIDADPDRARDTVARYFNAYYGPGGQLNTEEISVYGPPMQAAQRLREYMGQGLHTLMLIPTSPHPDQVDRLAEAVALARDPG